MDTAAVKPSETETETALKSPTKSHTHSDSSSLALSTQGQVSPARSLTLSTSMDQEYPDEAYILLDECFSGASSAVSLSTSSGTPSPGNTLGSRNAVPLAAEYRNLDSTSDGKSVSELAGSFVHTRSADGVFEDVSVSKGNDSTGVGIWDSRSTNTEFMAHSKHEDVKLPPALPAKMLSAVPGVEYDVPISGLVHGHALYSATSPLYGSTAAPPQPHMVVHGHTLYSTPSPLHDSTAAPQPHMAHGRTHRYINTAPAVVRNQTPTSAAMQRNYTELPAARSLGSPTTRSAQQNAAAPPSLLPPRTYG